MPSGIRVTAGRLQGPTAQIERALASRNQSRMMGPLFNGPTMRMQGNTAVLQTWALPFQGRALMQPQGSGPGYALSKRPITSTTFTSFAGRLPWTD